MSSVEDQDVRKSPVAAIVAWLRRLFGADAITGTLLPSIMLGVALSVTPTALLLFSNGHVIAKSGPFYIAIGATSVIAAATVVLLSRWLAPHVAGGLVAALGYGFYSLSWVPGSNQLPSLTFFWILTALPAAAVIIWLMSNSRLVVSVASAASTALAAFLVVSSFASGDVPIAAEDGAEIPEALALSGEPVRTPNVYLFVLDGFANPQVTAEQFADHDIDFRVDDALAKLETLGLQHDREATSNYGQTILSMPSMLNAAYPHTPEAPLRIAEVWGAGTPAIRGNNLLVDSLRSIGYEYWSASSGAWDPSRCDPTIADVCLGDDAGNAEAMKAVWWDTPLRWQLGVTDFRSLPEPQTVVDSILDTRLTRTSDAPYVVVSHIIGPHQPYRYEADCSFRDKAAPGTTLEGGHLAEFRPLYANQARCLTEILATAMDDLLDADPDALIVVQADHGSGFESASGAAAAWTERMARERLGVFRATRLPDDCRSDNPRSQSVINTTPILLACIWGTDPELIEPRHFFTDTSSETNDITEAMVDLS